MTFHQALVAYSGVAFFAAGLFTLGIWRMIGPSDHDRLTIGQPVRWIVFAHGLSCIGRGVTLIFPGKLVAVAVMSPMVPIAASTTLLVSAAVAELLQRYRLPPPLMDRFLRAVAAFRHDGPYSLAQAAMATPTAAMGEAQAGEAAAVHLGNPSLRRAVLTACGLGLLILLLIVLRAAAAEIPRG